MVDVTWTKRKLIFVSYIKPCLECIRRYWITVGAWVSDYTLNLMETQMLQNIFRSTFEYIYNILQSAENLTVGLLFLFMKLQLCFEIRLCF